tara:strand:- start:979 stop:1386 length:408 start_codon:yes stop_codon:yes gene_type:complete
MKLFVFVKNLFVDLLYALWGALSGVLEFALSTAHWLHVEAPRLEGLLVGVLLAWLLSRRDKHPLLRVLSAPLRLVLEVLDLAWDHLVELLSDTKDTVLGVIQQGRGALIGRIKSVWSSMLGGLASLRDRLRRKSQ